MQPPRSNEYSAFRSRCHDQNESDDDFFIDEIALTRNGSDDLSDDEILADLNAIVLPTDMPENVLASGNMPENVPSRCNSGRCRKMSPKGVRRSAQKDHNVIEKIQKFEFAPGDPRSDSLVAHQSPTSISHATAQPLSITPPVRIPDWEDVTDAVKLFSATLDIMTTPETAPYAFSFNLTPEAITKAKASPAGALDHLKRNLDKTLSRAGLSIPYWFCLDIDRKERLHTHGAFAAHPELVPAIRSAMVKAWGQWEKAGKHLQLVVKPCNEGWAGYAMRNQKRVAKIVGKRTFTIKNRAGAERTYSTIRRIMAL